MVEKEVLNIREETERTVKKSLSKELKKLANEVKEIQSSLSKHISLIDNSERRHEDIIESLS